MGARSEEESTEAAVKTSGLSVGPHLTRVTVGPSGADKPEGGIVGLARPQPGQVAKGEDTVAEAFWALLEKAWYTVW